MNKNIKVVSLFGVLFLCMYLFKEYYNANIEEQINEAPYWTIAKIYDVKYGARNKLYEYKYRFDSKIYYDKIPVETTKNNEDFLGYFFEIKISTKKPELGIINLDRKVLDDVKINNAEL